jgi:hypothetical protein
MLCSIAKDLGLARGNSHHWHFGSATTKTLFSGWNRRRLKSFSVRSKHHIDSAYPEDDVMGAIVCDSPGKKKFSTTKVAPAKNALQPPVTRLSPGKNVNETKYFILRELIAFQASRFPLQTHRVLPQQALRPPLRHQAQELSFSSCRSRQIYQPDTPFRQYRALQRWL